MSCSRSQCSASGDQARTRNWVKSMCGSRNFRQGGVQVRLTKKALTFFFFFGPQLILQKSNGQFQRNLSFFKVPEGVQHFPGGSNFFQGGGGSNCLFPIETHITCDFPGGSGPPVPPSGSALEIKMLLLTYFYVTKFPVKHVNSKQSRKHC